MRSEFSSFSFLTSDFSVSRHNRHSKHDIVSFKKNDFGVFQLSRGARVLCCKNGVVLHKTYLAICPMQINPSRRAEHFFLEKRGFMPRMHLLTAWVQSY
ncbi:hypothetical protein HMPREF1981_02266 [Bacteroides pyogenes F0041]|uniref:Uncharacterized protein n=1 Tax=Bacteroides pyogenes F0041 TaxID=1321819 RepID=U2CJE1_9BACE|nr:hypothetical protein HMPREF1981_02266 [Bacteroides pyogenes F0041]